MSSSQAAEAPALSLRNVSKTFPGQRALDSVDLDVERGEVHALLGENGSGKSTLIKILSGYHQPDPGCRVEVAGEELALGAAKASFAAGLRFVHQHLGVVLEMNAMENVALEAGYTRPALIDWRSQARLTRQLLQRLGVEMDLRRPLAECRPVERSAVAIARALRDDGEGVRAVVLDEPTSSLPVAETERLFELIRGLAASGVAIIYVSHRLDEVFEVADRVSVLRDGRLQGTRPVQGLARAELINLIVGRELASQFESNPAAESAADTPQVLLEVTSVRSDRLQDLSISVGAGEIVGVVGVAGSGREDAARVLVGALPRESGRVIVEGREVPPDDPGAARARGLVLALSNTQSGSAVREFSVAENISLPSLKDCRQGLRLVPKRERTTAMRWIRNLDVRPRRPDRSYDHLSGGNQQKVILAKWLNCDPKVLILDEPTAGVDVGARQLIYNLIREKAAQGIGVVLCSSDLEDLVSVADRAVVLRDGRVQAELGSEVELTESTLLRHALGTEEGPPAKGTGPDV